MGREEANTVVGWKSAIAGKPVEMGSANANAQIGNSLVMGDVLIKMMILIVGIAGIMYVPPSPSTRNCFIYTWLTKRSVPKEAKNATMDNVNLNVGVINSFVMGSVLIKMMILIAGIAGIMYVPLSPSSRNCFIYS